MAVSDKTNVVVQTYTRGQYPVMEDGLRRYFQDELQRIELAIGTLAQASIQVADTPPANPVKGMVRYAVSPWSPVGTTTGVTVNHTVTVSGGVFNVDGVANPILTFGALIEALGPKTHLRLISSAHCRQYSGHPNQS